MSFLKPERVIEVRKAPDGAAVNSQGRQTLEPGWADNVAPEGRPSHARPIWSPLRGFRGLSRGPTQGFRFASPLAINGRPVPGLEVRLRINRRLETAPTGLSHSGASRLAINGRPLRGFGGSAHEERPQLVRGVTGFFHFEEGQAAPVAGVVDGGNPEGLGRGGFGLLDTRERRRFVAAARACGVGHQSGPSRARRRAVNYSAQAV